MTQRRLLLVEDQRNAQRFARSRDQPISAVTSISARMSGPNRETTSVSDTCGEVSQLLGLPADPVERHSNDIAAGRTSGWTCAGDGAVNVRHLAGEITRRDGLTIQIAGDVTCNVRRAGTVGNSPLAVHVGLRIPFSIDQGYNHV